MKRKRDIKTKQITKYKPRLNVHGGQQQYRIHYFDTYAPVVTWTLVRLILVVAILDAWATRQVDFVMTYAQADIEFDLYMNLPKGVQVSDRSRGTHVLKLLKNVYGQKQADRVWYNHLKDRLVKIGFTQSAIDECVFYH
eukprot:11012538-Ditylum_brightwellii.AAC.1